MNSAPIKPLISTSDLDKIDVRIGVPSGMWLEFTRRNLRGVEAI